MTKVRPVEPRKVAAGSASFDMSKVDAFDDHDGFVRTYEEAIRLSQDGIRDSHQKRLRYHILYQAALRACLDHPDLDMVECGCFLGHSTFMIARALERNGFKGELHVFDSFEGLSEFREEDHGPVFPTDEARANVRRHFKSDFERVEALLARFPFVKLYRGWIPDRFNDIPERPLSLLSIDVDLFDPILTSLENFYPRLVGGGSVFLDDYGSTSFPGARLAVDKYLAGTPHTMLLRLPFGSALLLK